MDTAGYRRQYILFSHLIGRAPGPRGNRAARVGHLDLLVLTVSVTSTRAVLGFVTVLKGLASHESYAYVTRGRPFLAFGIRTPICLSVMSRAVFLIPSIRNKLKFLLSRCLWYCKLMDWDTNAMASQNIVSDDNLV